MRRIIYLGGLGDDQSRLSPHLRSRQEVGTILAAAGVPTTELRAAIVIGAGSASFEMLRELTERLPMMVCPRWVTSPVQPIAVADVLASLTACLAVPATAGRVLEIGGPEVMTYEQMMRRFARLRGLRRLILRVPVLTSRLSSYWVDIVTSVPAAVARPLIEGLRSAVVVRDPAAQALLPVPLTPFDEAVGAALRERRPGRQERPLVWLRRLPGHLLRVARDRLWPPVVVDRSTRPVAAAPAVVYAELARIGGANGWYFMDWAWRLRGALDRWLGGPGLDRATPLPATVTVGERRDLWQVWEAEPGRRVRLRALMRLPGEAELEWSIASAEGAVVRSTKPRASGRRDWVVACIGTACCQPTGSSFAAWRPRLRGGPPPASGEMRAATGDQHSRSRHSRRSTRTTAPSAGLALRAYSGCPSWPDAALASPARAGVGTKPLELDDKAMRKRKVWIEPLFGEANEWHRVRTFRLRGIWKVNCEGVRIAAEARAMLWRLVATHLHDERERVLVQLRYEVGLTSAEIRAQRSDLIPLSQAMFGRYSGHPPAGQIQVF